ncbi:MAG: CDP-alcohol phosphatidyltransferase family protein [Synechococcales cyanobacterium]
MAVLDSRLRQWKDHLLTGVSRTPIGQVSPTALTLTGMGVGIAASIVTWQHHYGWGLALWILNRTVDGLDGTVARLHQRQSDLGGYLDMMADVLIYALLPCSLAWSQAMGWWSLALLLASFYINLCSWTYLSAILAKRQQQPTLTTIAMPGGLIEGTETILFYCLFLIFPEHLVVLFSVMTGLVTLTALQRVLWACRHL